MDSLLIYAISADSKNINSNFSLINSNKKKIIFINIDSIYNLIFNPDYVDIFKGKVDINILKKLTEHKGNVVFAFSVVTENTFKLIGFLIEEATNYFSYNLAEYYKNNIETYYNYDLFAFDYEMNFFYSRPISKEKYNNNTVASFTFIK